MNKRIGRAALICALGGSTIAHSEDAVSDTFIVRAGWFVRQRVIDGVTASAWEHGLECKHEVAGRTIRFTVSGKPDKVKVFVIGVAWAFPESK